MQIIRDPFTVALLFSLSVILISAILVLGFYYLMTRRRKEKDQGRVARRGRFRVVEFDDYDSSELVIGEYGNLEKAKQISRKKKSGTSDTYSYNVYDDTGKIVFSASNNPWSSPP